jgi:hypothetical protein
MSLRKRLERLENRLQVKALPVATRELTGMEWNQLLAEVDAAMQRTDTDLIKQIMTFTEELGQVVWQNEMTGEKYLTDEGHEQPTPHFFIRWLWGLHDGSWRLPDPVPRAVLEGFVSLRGAVLWRCEDCLTALGNGRLYDRCPVCQSMRLAVRNLSGGEPEWRSVVRSQKKK